MKKLTLFFVLFIACFHFYPQSFVRSELTTTLSTPWEMTLGPDGYLWITELGGEVSRVDPNTGAKLTVFKAADYCPGYPAEQCPACYQPNIGVGTLGLTLHPDFLNPATAFIYFAYSYNSGTTTSPSTKFKIVRLTWSAVTNSVTAFNDLINQLPTGYDHLGGRLLAVTQNSTNYLYFSVGDNGVSEMNAPGCYNPPTLNPNNYVQDTAYKNGKIHRFNIDGSIPADNPIPGSSVFTRGHRNPQGLIYNKGVELIYDIEHGDRTDDEINILESGKNYGWKNIRGYHTDDNYPGEAASISSFTPNPGITGDGLKEAFFSWCATPQPTVSNNADWCTVAPSDGVYYNYNGNGIPGWDNSLLVVTLKNGTATDQEMYKFQLSQDGLSLVPSTSVSPNPVRFFGADQALNGRLRDIAVSPDGNKIYLINNGGADRDKITVYTYNVTAIKENTIKSSELEVFPNPAETSVNIKTSSSISKVEILNLLGEVIYAKNGHVTSVNMVDQARGLYVLKVSYPSGRTALRTFVKE
ncbi:MAG: Quinoprotein glucose dehydrogenase [Bacteroidetes bacterium]|nr:Quinoprotein glucose dehydrogenase [Bacteroidota bacterium]